MLSVSAVSFVVRRVLKTWESTGGAIGTGLFVGSGSALRTGGPAAVLVAWSLIGFMMISVTQVRLAYPLLLIFL